MGALKQERGCPLDLDMHMAIPVSGVGTVLI